MSLNKIEIATIITVLSACIGFGTWVGTLQEKVNGLEIIEKDVKDLCKVIDKESYKIFEENVQNLLLAAKSIDRQIDKGDKWREFYIIELKKDIWIKWLEDLEDHIAAQGAPATIKQKRRLEEFKKELEYLRSREETLKIELEREE